MAQLEAQTFLDLAEDSNRICFLDIESSGNLRADFGSVAVVTIKSFRGAPKSFVVKRVGDDKQLVKQVRDYLSKFTIVVHFYGRRFDIPFINSRLLRHGLPPVAPIHQLDLCEIVKFHTLASRKSLAAMLSWLVPDLEQKMNVSQNVWADLPANPKLLGTLRKRCESDVRATFELYKRVRHLVRNVTL